MKKKQYFQSTEQKKRKVTHTVAQEYSPVPTAAEQRSLPVMAPTAAPVPAWQQSKGPHQLWHPQRHQLLLQQSKGPRQLWHPQQHQLLLQQSKGPRQLWYPQHQVMYSLIFIICYFVIFPIHYITDIPFLILFRTVHQTNQMRISCSNYCKT
jgi:hypothetical protein